MNEKKAKKLLTDVKKTYQNIATEFSATRSKPGNEFKLFLPYIKDGSLIADIGCGNGRLLGFLQQETKIPHQYTGIDNNSKFIEICKKKYPEANFIEGDMTDLPLKTSSVDLALYMRSIHHIPSKKIRNKVISEAHRIVKPGGTVMITVWNLWQKKNWIQLFKAFLRSIFTLGKYEYNDTFIKWGQKNYRYYHAFTMNEFKKLLLTQNFKIVHTEKSKDLIIIATKQ